MKKKREKRKTHNSVNMAVLTKRPRGGVACGVACGPNLAPLSGNSFQLLFSRFNILREHGSKRDICAICRDTNLNTVRACS